MQADTHVFDLLPAYALGSLIEPEAQRVAEHLSFCAACRAELADFQRVTYRLGLAAPVQSPSAGLRRRLLDQVRGAERTRPATPQPGLLPRLLPIGGLVALTLIFFFIVGSLFSRQNQMLVGPLGMRAIALENTANAPGASGFVIISADVDNGVLVVDELPALDEAYEYQVWLVKDGEVINAALFSVDEDGYRGLRLEAPGKLSEYAEVRITIEPLGGSDAPTGEEVLSGSLFEP